MFCHQSNQTPRYDYSNSEVVCLGRITCNTNKMSDSKDETLCHQSIALAKIILKAEIKIFICWFIMCYPNSKFIENRKRAKKWCVFYM